MMRYVIPEIPRSTNEYAGRQNVWEYRKEKNRWVGMVNLFCRPRPSKPYEKAQVTLVYYFKTAARHDPDNYSGKMILDGLTEARIIKDDSFNCIELRIKQGGVDPKNPRVEIEVQEIST